MHCSARKHRIAAAQHLAFCRSKIFLTNSPASLIAGPPLLHLLIQSPAFLNAQYPAALCRCGGVQAKCSKQVESLAGEIAAKQAELANAREERAESIAVQDALAKDIVETERRLQVLVPVLAPHAFALTMCQWTCPLPSCRVVPCYDANAASILVPTGAVREAGPVITVQNEKRA
jgi:hypothetical protein